MDSLDYILFRDENKTEFISELVKKDQVGLLKKIDVLLKDQNWIAENPITAKKFCKLLLDKEFTNKKCVGKAEQIKNREMIKHPDLFEIIKIGIGDAGDKIPILHNHSEKFKAVLRWNASKLTSYKIESTLEKPIRLELLNYLKTNEIKITDDNVVALLSFSDEHLMTDLKIKCLYYLMNEILNENCSKEDVEYILDLFNDYNFKDFKREECLLALLKKCNEGVFASSENETIIELKKIADECKKLNIEIKEVNGQLYFSLLNLSQYTANHFELLERIERDWGIRSLEIGFSTTHDITKLANICNHIEHLRKIDHSLILVEKVEIPEKLLKNVTDIYYDSITLESLNVPNARTVHCHICSNLTTLIAPKAVNIQCDACIELKNIEASPEKIYCDGLTSLEKLVLGNAKEIHCKKCPGLKIIIGPKAENVECETETLERLFIPEVKVLRGSGLKHLRHLYAPKAGSIDLTECDSDILIITGKKTKVNFNQCRGRLEIRRVAS